MAKESYIPGHAGELRAYRIARLARVAVFAWPVMTLILASKGLSFTQIGLLNSLGAFIAMVIEIPAGRLADRYGHRRSLILSNFLMALGFAVLIPANGFAAAIVSEVILAVGLATGTGSDSALLYTMHKDAGYEKNYSRTLASIRKSLTLIALVPSVVGPFLFSLGSNIPLWSSLPLYVVAALLFIIIPNSAKIEREDSSEKPGRWIERMRSTPAMRHFLAIALLGMVIGIGVSNFSQFLSPYLSELGFPIEFLGAVLIAGTGFAWLGNHALAWTTNLNIELPKVLVLVAVLLSISIGAQCFSLNWAIAVALYGLFRFFSSLFGGPLDVQINAMASDNNRATLLSVAALLDDVATVSVDPLIGIAIDMMGFRVLYGIVGLLSAIIAAGFGIFLRAK